MSISELRDREDMSAHKTELDPFRILMSVLIARPDSDALLAAVMSSGLRFDQDLSPKASYSHTTRVRALSPRIIKAYDALANPDKLAVAQAVVAHLVQTRTDQDLHSFRRALAKVGWEIQNGDLVVGTPELREMFFPKGSQWDAFVVLKATIAEAEAALTIVDSYADCSVFQLLASRSMTGLSVRILCSKFADAIAAERIPFLAQYPGGTVEVRRSKDFHDRFVILDDKVCIHIGASIKDAGKSACMISRLQDANNRAALLAAISAAWEAGTRIP